MGGCRCSFRNCTNSTQTSIGRSFIHFFHYPIRDQKRLETWLEYAQKREFIQLPVNQLRNKVICGDHFVEKMFMNYKRKRLIRTATPTLMPTSDGSRKVLNVVTNEIENDIRTVYSDDECEGSADFGIRNTSVYTINDVPQNEIIEVIQQNEIELIEKEIEENDDDILTTDNPFEKSSDREDNLELLHKSNATTRLNVDDKSKINILKQPIKVKPYKNNLSLVELKPNRPTMAVRVLNFGIKPDGEPKPLRSDSEQVVEVGSKRRAAQQLKLLPTKKIALKNEISQTLLNPLKNDEKNVENSEMELKPTDLVDSNQLSALIEKKNKCDFLEAQIAKQQKEIDTLKNDLITIRTHTESLMKEKQDLQQKVDQMERLSEVKPTVVPAFNKQNVPGLTKSQLFNNIKKYLNPSMTTLLRMELFADAEREYKLDEKSLSIELYGFGEVYDHLRNEWRFRLPTKRDVGQWMKDKLSEAPDDCEEC